MVIIVTMKCAGVADVKANLSRYLEQVKRGQEIIVTDRGRPVAKLVPLPPTEEAESARRERLIRAGVILPGKGRLRRSLLKPPRGPRASAGVLDALLEERAQGR
jgi:prevent-host-death family protein